ncbi:hypothetical protein YC2023_066216 [Brassica napus]
MLTLPVDGSGDFGPRWLSNLYTQDVRGCPPVHTRRLWLSVAVRPHTQDVCGCPCVSVCVRQHAHDIRGCPSVHISARCTHRTSVGVHQHTQDVCGCPSAHTRRLWLSVCVRVCPSAHTGRPWLSISTHISTLVLGLSTLDLPVDCSGDFGPRGLSVKYIQDVRGCPSAHPGRPWVSVSTHRTSVAVRVCPCVSVSTHKTSVAVHQYTYQHVGPWTQHTGPSRGLYGLILAHVSCLFSTHRTSVGVRQHAHDVCGCPSAHTGRPWLSVCVCVCPSAHTGRLWLSISIHISTLVLGLRTMTLLLDCSGEFGPRGMSVQYTQDLCGCPPAHTGRSWLSVSTHRTSVAVRVCPSAHTGLHTGRSWVSASTHRTSVAVCGCPPAHTGRSWLSLCVCVCPSAHTRRSWLSISTHISTLILGLSTLALPLDCVGYFGPRGLSVLYTQDVRGCPPAHTRRLWLSVAVRPHSQDVCGCPCVFVCVRVRQSAHTGHPWLSISTHISTLVLGLSTLTMDCSGDFGPCGLSVQYTQDVHGCPSAQTGRLWVSVSPHKMSVAVRVCPCVSVRTHRTFVAVHQYTYQHAGPWTQHAGPSRRLFGTSVGVRQHTQDVRGCPCVSVSTHKTSVAVHQYTYQHVGPWTQHADPSHGLFRTSVAVRVCPCVYVSTHKTSVAVHLYTYQHVVHTGRPWVSASTHMTSVAVRVCLQLSVCVRVCPSMSISTHRMSVAVHQYTYQHVGPWTQHAGPSRGLFGTHISTLVLGLSTLALPVDCLGDFSPRGLSVQYTQDVRGCPPAHTGRPWLSVAIRQHTQDIHGWPCVSVSTHRMSVAVHQYTYQHAGPWTQHAGPSRGLYGLFSAHGLSVQYTQDVRGCPTARTGRPWVSVSTHRTSVAVRVCLCVSVSTHMTSVAVHQYTFQHYTQDVCGCPPAHTGRSWLSVSTHRTSVAVRVCPSAHTGCLWLSISTHINTLVLPLDCSGDFGPRRFSVQYTQDVRGCPLAHTGHPWLSVAVRQHTQEVRGCQCVSVSTHMTSVAVNQYISACWSLDSAR